MKILSISDVITNSSSEVFVIHSKPEFQDEINKEIPEFLTKLCDFLEFDVKEIMEFDVSNSTYIDEDFNYNVFENDLLINSVDDNTIPYWMMELIEHLYYFPKFKDKFNGYFAEDLGKVTTKRWDWDKEEYAYKNEKIRSIQRHHLG